MVVPLRFEAGFQPFSSKTRIVRVLIDRYISEQRGGVSHNTVHSNKH
jgi:hypothetical protein